MEIGLTAVIAFRKQQKSLWLIGFHSKDSDDEVATEQLTSVVDA